MATCAQLLKAVEGASISGDPNVEIDKVTVDSREVASGDLFVAVDGYHLDGLQFVPDAVSRGAVAIVASKPFVAEVPCKAIVPDTRAAVAAIAAEYYRHPSRQLSLLAVTGTNGKTTITHLVRSILERQGGAVGLIGTLGYFDGRRMMPAPNTTPGPIELQRLLRGMCAAGLKYAVMEISSHGLAMKRVERLHLAAGAISNITQDHLDFHHDFESYRQVKAQLLDLLQGRDQRVILNADDPNFDYLRQRAKAHCLAFSASGRLADFQAKEIHVDARGSRFVLVTPQGSAEVSLRLLGRFNVANALCAAALSYSVGADMRSIVAGLAAQEAVRGRAEQITGGQDFTILVDFAHTPDALEQIGQAAREICRGKLLLLFGCGGDRDRSKRAPMGRAASKYADLVIVTSDNPRSEDPLRIIEDIEPGLNGSIERIIEPRREHAIVQALSLCRPGDVLVVAGKGHEDYQIVGERKSHFDDREIIRAWLEGRQV